MSFDEQAWRDRRKALKISNNEIRRWRAIKYLGDVCNHCGISDRRVLQIDHVFGDGCIERKQFNGQDIQAIIIKAFELRYAPAIQIIMYRYQILCANCHVIKTKENEEIGPNQLFRMASNMGCIQQVRQLKHMLHEEEYKRKYESSSV